MGALETSCHHSSHQATQKWVAGDGSCKPTRTYESMHKHVFDMTCYIHV